MKHSISNLCNTSVQDAKCSLNHISDPDLVRFALAYEKKHMNRSSLIKAFESKIRRLEKGNAS